MSRNDTMDSLRFAFNHKLSDLKCSPFVLEIDKKKKEKQDIQDQLNRIESKLDKLLGPQLINGVWR